MMSCSLDNIISNYQLLSHPDPTLRENANLFLLGVIDQPQIWHIAEEMITKVVSPDFQLLGSQLLYQKIERDLDQLQNKELSQLREFIFGQLTSQALSLAAISKLASSAALIASVLFLEHWPTLIDDMVDFMKVSMTQLRNGLIFLQRFPDEIRTTNRIKHGIKLQIREQLMLKMNLLAQTLMSALSLNDNAITTFVLQVIQSWIKMGFPLLSYSPIIKTIIELTLKHGGVFLESACKVISASLQATAQLKFQTLGEIDLNVQRNSYSQEQIASLGMIITYLRQTKLDFFKALATLEDIESIQTYTSIVKELLLSYGFLLLQQVGYELVELMMKTLDSNDLKLSYSTFQFWTEFCEKLSKIKTTEAGQCKFWNITQGLLDVILKKSLLENEALLFQLVNEEDTVDDINSISFNEYRKEAQHIITFVYDYFTKKKEREGSAIFFQKLMFYLQADTQTAHPGRGLELVIYSIKSALQSMVKEYDRQYIVQFMEKIINDISEQQNGKMLPVRVAAEIMGLIKDCSRQIKENSGLFLKCIGFCLGFIDDDSLCHHAVYAFQSLMESIGDLANQGLLNDLMTFYSSKTFTKQLILEKILEAIVTTVTKLNNKETINQFLNKIMKRVEEKYNALLNQKTEVITENYRIALIEIKILLDTFDGFLPEEKNYYSFVFLKISVMGMNIIHYIVTNYLTRRIKFSNVNELGLSLSVYKNGLKICDHLSQDLIPFDTYTRLMDVAISILQPNDIQYFLEYFNLLQIVSKALTQFSNIGSGLIEGWLVNNLPTINSFFLGYVERQGSFLSVDPDILKWYFTLQESSLINNKRIYLNQPQHEQILNLALMSIKHLNQKNLQRKVIYFIYLCVQMKDAYAKNYEVMLKTVFASIPFLNNICFMNVGRILVILLENLDVRGKEQLCRQLLDYQPYLEVDKDLKEMMAKFMAFVIDTKVERYIKGLLIDLADLKWKKTGSDLSMNLELRYASWKKQYNRSVKSGQVPK